MICTSTNLYYSSTERSRIAGGWIQAIYFDIVMDAYKRTDKDKYKDLINRIYRDANRRYSNFDWAKIKNVKKWIYDDMLWWIGALARAYNITDKNKYLMDAKAGFKFVWKEAWDSEH